MCPGALTSSWPRCRGGRHWPGTFTLTCSGTISAEASGVGGVLDAAQALLEHATPTSTQVYLHPSQDRLRRGPRRMYEAPVPTATDADATSPTVKA
jgi:hypothetical protein